MKLIYLTEKDYHRLQTMVQANQSDPENEQPLPLTQVITRAQVIPTLEVSPNVVTMNSTVRLKAVDSVAEMIITVVYPQEHHMPSRKVSVLSPVGAAVIGSSVGQQVSWPTPEAEATYQIAEIIYQPEAAGDFHL